MGAMERVVAGTIISLLPPQKRERSPRKHFTLSTTSPIFSTQKTSISQTGPVEHFVRINGLLVKILDCNKPWNKDPVINQPVFHGSYHLWVLITAQFQVYTP